MWKPRMFLTWSAWDGCSCTRERRAWFWIASRFSSCPWPWWLFGDIGQRPRPNNESMADQLSPRRRSFIQKKIVINKNPFNVRTKIFAVYLDHDALASGITTAQGQHNSARFHYFAHSLALFYGRRLAFNSKIQRIHMIKWAHRHCFATIKSDINGQSFLVLKVFMFAATTKLSQYTHTHTYIKMHL